MNNALVGFWIKFNKLFSHLKLHMTKIETKDRFSRIGDVVIIQTKRWDSRGATRQLCDNSLASRGDTTSNIQRDEKHQQSLSNSNILLYMPLRYINYNTKDVFTTYTVTEPAQRRGTPTARHRYNLRHSENRSNKAIRWYGQRYYIFGIFKKDDVTCAWVITYKHAW